jgi:PIN domain nuclease of toxin-antitoxin system
MSAVLLDTHAWAWLLSASPRLSTKAVRRVEAADEVYVSPISFFEIAQKVRLGKWPEMAAFASKLPKLLRDQGGRATPFSDEIGLRAGLMEWSHRDPFDRMIAATALALDLPLISADPAFDGLSGFERWRERVW